MKRNEHMAKFQKLYVELKKSDSKEYMFYGFIYVMLFICLGISSNVLLTEREDGELSRMIEMLFILVWQQLVT